MIPATAWADQGNGTAWWIPPNGPEPSNDWPGWDEWDPDTGPFWKLLDRPCDTCGDTRVVPQDHPIAARCPDCINGRHTFPLDVDTGERYVTADRSQATNRLERRRVSVVPDMIVPIVANSNDWEHGHINHIDLMGTTAILRTNTEGFSQDSEVIDPFPSDAKPGGFAVLLRVAS